jgi:general secretion pathway protein A
MYFVDKRLAGGWDLGESPGHLEFPERVWQEIAAYAMEGFSSGPSGGPEVGGLLLGTRTEGQVRVERWCAIECEHAKGPRFELSEKDEAELRESIAGHGAAPGPAVVGWFQSRYWHEGWSLSTQTAFSLSAADVELHNRHFGEPWQVALVIQRAKSGPLRAVFFYRTQEGTLDSVSREFGKSTAEKPVAQVQAAVEASGPRVEASAVHAAAQTGAGPGGRKVEDWADRKARSRSTEKRVSRPGEYWTWFGLQYNPFGAQGSPKSIYWSRQHRNLLTRLFHDLVRGGSTIVLTGQAGTGKTMLLEMLGTCLTKANSTQAQVEFAFVRDGHISVDQLYQLVARDLALDAAPDNKPAVLDAIGKLARSGESDGEGRRGAALLIDEAHILSSEVMEHLRILDALYIQNTKVLQVVLAGQPKLESRLRSPEYRSLKQRISARYVLEPLNEEESAEFVMQSLLKAGLEEEALFSLEVVREIHRYAHGIPRIVKGLCDHVLRTCAEEGVKAPTLPILEQARKQLSADPTLDCELHAEPVDRARFEKGLGMPGKKRTEVYH